MRYISAFDPALLDLLPHFLGIAQHDNINAAPSAVGSPAAVMPWTGPRDGRLASPPLSLQHPSSDGLRNGRTR